MTTMTTVRLYGSLGKTFGESFELAISSPAEAIRLLDANFRGLMTKFIRPRKFHVIIGDGEKAVHLSAQTTPEDTTFQRPGKTIHIIPAGEGAGLSGKALISIVVGTVLVAGAIILSGGTLAAPLGESLLAMQGTLYGTVASIGAAMFVGGVMQLLSPVPKTNYDEKDSAKSTMFNGPVNLTAQGQPVPIVYGRRKTGSIVVSVGLSTDKSSPTGDAANGGIGPNWG